MDSRADAVSPYIGKSRVVAMEMLVTSSQSSPIDPCLLWQLVMNPAVLSRHQRYWISAIADHKFSKMYKSSNITIHINYIKYIKYN